MPHIQILDKETIDKIAAGEVIERPMSVVKELVENAIDAKASSVTVEIKEGGISFIRITDNGCGIDAKEVELAFFAHATSKISSAEDLNHISSLGFRGEALASIAAISQVELITKTPSALTGTRLVIEGSETKELEEVGAPNGTTFLIRNLFYNTPARLKFLKSPQTEAGYISALMERIALSHPEISFKFIHNNQVKMQTSGNSKPKEIIYQIYGKDIANALVEVHAKNDLLQIDGYIAKPVVSRGNRNYENYFVNGRYIKSSLLSKGIEDAYKNYLMQHQYPFTALTFTIAGEEVDVNVHPQKMELRFRNQDDVYKFVLTTLEENLAHRELIPEVPVAEQTKEEKKSEQEALKPAQNTPEPFERNRIEKNRLQQIRSMLAMDSPYEVRYEDRKPRYGNTDPFVANPYSATTPSANTDSQPDFSAATAATATSTETAATAAVITEPVVTGEQETLPFLSEQALPDYKIIGQVFDTFWIVQLKDKLFYIDQHAAHEKVLFEKLMKRKETNQFSSQQISPPILLSLSMAEEQMLLEHMDAFTELGYSIENFGGREYTINAIPGNLYGLDEKQYFLEMLDDLVSNGKSQTTETLYMKIATMSCKAAIKGNNKISIPEFETLLRELLVLDNPYHCPHGRPTIISMSKYELEKKFKRIV